MGVFMPGLPFFSFVSTPPQGANSSPLTSTNASENNTLSQYGGLQGLPNETGKDEQASSFWQYFQAANQLTPLPQGQDLAADMMPENMTGNFSELLITPIEHTQSIPVAMDGTDELMGDLIEVEEINIEDVNYDVLMDPMYSPQTLSDAELDDASPQGLQYLESLRRAQPHVQTMTAQTSGADAELDELASQIAAPVLNGTQTKPAAAAQVLTPPVNPNPVPEEMMAQAAQVGPQMVKMDGQSKTINLDDLGLEPLAEEVDVASIHEAPKTLTVQKDGVNPANIQVEVATSQEAKLQIPTDGLLHQAKAPDTPAKSLALETPQAQTQSVQEKVNASFNKLDVPPQNPQWNDHVAKRIAIMASEGMQSARIQLDPPELGSLEIKIKVQHDQVSVAFGSNNQMVREALDAQTPRLRDLLEQQGVDLVDVNVSEQGQQNDSGREEWGEQGDVLVDGEQGEMDESFQSESQVLSSDSLVDYFA